MSTAVNLPADKFDTAMTFVRPEPAPARVSLDKLAVLPGFNTRVKDAEYNERVVGIAESIAANGFFDDKPFAVTMIDGSDVVYIYDGEHRFDAAKQALLDGAEFPDGLPVAWAKDGATVKDLTIHLAHGNNGERLNMVELAAVVRRMQGLKMSKDEIAAALGRTTRHVDNLFVLAEANQTVKKAVASGKIAGAEAVKLLRKDPATAGEKIAAAVKAAEEKGKAKATPKTMADAPKGPKTKTVQMSMNFPVGKTMAEVLKAMATEIREFIEFDKGSDVISTDALVRFSVTTVDREAESAAVEAAKAREAAAAKRAEEAKEREAAKKAAAAEKEKARKAKEAEKAKAAKAKEAEKAKKAKKAKEAEKARAAEAKLLAEATAKKGSGKAASGGKAATVPKKAAQADSGAAATSAAKKAENSASGAESPAPEGTDDNNGL